MFSLRHLFASFNGKVVSAVPATGCGFATAGKKKSLEAKLGIPEKPKKPLTPFFQFAQEVNPGLMKQFPALKISEIGRLAGQKWNELDQDKKTRMQEQYVTKMSKYVEDMQAYNATLTQEQRDEVEKAREETKEKRKEFRLRKEKREMGQPKRPPSTYGIFFQEQLAAMNLKGSTETTKKVAEAWNQLSDEAKEGYKAKYATIRKEFEERLLDWEEDMVRRGKHSLIRNKSQVEPGGTKSKKSSQ